MERDGNFGVPVTSAEAQDACYVRKLRRKFKDTQYDVARILMLVAEAEENLRDDLHSLSDIYDLAGRAFGHMPMQVAPAEYGEICVKRLKVLCQFDPKEARSYYRFVKHEVTTKDARVYLAVAEMETRFGRCDKAYVILAAGLSSGAVPAEQLHSMLQHVQNHKPSAVVCDQSVKKRSGHSPPRPRTLRYSGCNGISLEDSSEEVPTISDLVAEDQISNAAASISSASPTGSHDSTAGTAPFQNAVVTFSTPAAWMRTCEDNLSPILEADSVEDPSYVIDSVDRRRSSARNSGDFLPALPESESDLLPTSSELQDYMPPSPLPGKDHMVGDGQVGRHTVSEDIAPEPVPTPVVSTPIMDTELSDLSVPPADVSVSEGSQKPPKAITVNGVSYVREQTVGRGGTSKVYAVMSPSGEALAVKRVVTQNSTHFEDLKQEVTLLQQLRHCPNVVQVFDSEVCPQRGIIQIVMERGGMDLGRFLNTSPDLSLGDIQVLWRQMLEAVQVIHDKGIIHSDLKPGNFLFVNGRLKLIDFGIAKKIDREMTHISRDNSVGTVSYMAPEAVTQGTHQIRRASDIWSLGIILYQIVYRVVPFAHLDPMQRVLALNDPHLVVSFPAGHRLENHSEEKKSQMLDVLSSCLRRDEQSRPHIPALLHHPFLNDSITLTRCSFDRTMEQLLTGFCEAARSAFEDDDLAETSASAAGTGHDEERDFPIPSTDYWQALSDEVWDRFSNGNHSRQVRGVTHVSNEKLDVAPARKVLQRWLARGHGKRQRTDAGIQGQVGSGIAGGPEPAAGPTPVQTAAKRPALTTKPPPPPPKGQGKGGIAPCKAAAPPGSFPVHHGGRPVASASQIANNVRQASSKENRPAINANLLQSQIKELKKVEAGSASTVANREDLGRSEQKSSETESLIFRRLQERRNIVADDRTAEITCTQWLVAP